jgi:hypothetical protein
VNLYLIQQSVNRDYDTYYDAVVAAASEEEARLIHPDGSSMSSMVNSKTVDGTEDDDDWVDYFRKRTWVTNPKDVSVKLIGVAVEGTKSGVICASFHAG